MRLDGHLDPTTSRWLWLVKWVLVVPHVVVLAVLWLAVFVLTVVAGFAILFTGRYPRPIFDFNAGVMRWTWRVSFYAIGAFATDRYPPFSLAPDPTYPADLTIDYPDHLSRGLVLVKWWLLALPQYVIVAFFAGGWGFGLHGSSRSAAGVGLIGVLALVAAVVLALRGRYPESIFDFVMGMNRWCYRVLGYAALMRDGIHPSGLTTAGRIQEVRRYPRYPKPPILAANSSEPHIEGCDDRLGRESKCKVFKGISARTIDFRGTQNEFRVRPSERLVCHGACGVTHAPGRGEGPCFPGHR